MSQGRGPSPFGYDILAALSGRDQREEEEFGPESGRNLGGLLGQAAQSGRSVQLTGNAIMATAQQVLEDAGVSKEGIDMALADVNMAQQVIDNPTVAIGFAQRFPAPRGAYGDALVNYADVANVQFTQQVGTDPELLKHFRGTDQQFTTDSHYVGPQTGAIKYKNGVIADPAAGAVFYPPTEAVPGSPVWLRNAQQRWSKERIHATRDRLKRFGYPVAEKGGWDKELIDSLSEFHRNRYLNFGEALPLQAEEAQERARQLIDPATLDLRIVQQYQALYGDDPNDTELKSWRQMVFQEMNERLGKGADPELALSGAEAAQELAFRRDPQNKYFAESQEENTELRDQLLGTFQTLNMMSR
jgi:hypothetical protein